MSVLSQSKNIEEALSKVDIQALIEEMVKEINMYGGIIVRSNRVLGQFNSRIVDQNDSVMPIQIQISALIDKDNFIERSEEFIKSIEG